jgi:hypothetical protein
MTESHKVMEHYGTLSLRARATDAGIAWFAQQRAETPSADRLALGIHVVMGAEFAAMSANLAQNLREGRARLLQAIVRKRSPTSSLRETK